MAGVALHSDDEADVFAARAIEASYFQPVKGVGDSETLRLFNLLHSLQHEACELYKSQSIVAKRPVELSLVPGEPPRLWVDRFTSVVMRPDFRTYRIEMQRHDGAEILQESGDMARTSGFLQNYMVERTTQAQQKKESLPEVVAPNGDPSLSTLVFVWLCGLTVGSCGVLIAYKLLNWR